jgi:hypothetical protein
MLVFLIICIGFISFCINYFTKWPMKYQALSTIACIGLAVLVTEKFKVHEANFATVSFTETTQPSSNEKEHSNNQH